MGLRTNMEAIIRDWYRFAEPKELRQPWLLREKGKYRVTQECLEMFQKKFIECNLKRDILRQSEYLKIPENLESLIDEFLNCTDASQLDIEPLIETMRDFRELYMNNLDRSVDRYGYPTS